MKRRTFLKMVGAVPLIAVIPKITAKEKWETILVSKASVPEYNREYRIVAKDKFSEPMLEAWSNMVGIEREPLETDEHLKERILRKIKRES